MSINPRMSMVASAFGFAVMAACVRLADDFGAAIPCFEKAFFRNVVALVIALIAFARMPRAEAVRLDRRSWWLLVLRSGLGTLGIFANFYALAHIPIADAQTLNKTAPFFTLLFAWGFLGERPSPRQFLALAIAFLGTVFIVRPGFVSLGDALPLAMGLVGGIAAGGAYATVRTLGSRGVPSALTVLFFSGFSCLASVPFTAAVFVPLTVAQILVLIGAGAGAALGQFGITCAYRRAAPREVAVWDYTNILFTVALGYLLFGQVSDRWSFAGFALIIIAALSRL